MPPGYQAYNTASAMNYASWGARLGGYLLNYLVSLGFLVPAFLAIFAVPREYQACTIDGEPEICNLPTSTGWTIVGIVGVLGMISYLVLYCRAIGKTGQFWGHRAANVRIVNASDGSPIGAGKALGRYFAHFLDAIPCYLGFFWPLWDQKKQTFADKICGTVSIRA